MQKNGRHDNSLCTGIKSGIEILSVNKKEMPFLKYMDGVIFSCDVNMLKPEHQIYENLLETFGLKADECVFIDDREENCQGARDVGIQAIQFTGFKQVTAELEKMGVK